VGQAPKSPAVVVGAGLNGLGIVRSLSQNNIPCHLIEANISDPTVRTRLATLHLVESISDQRLTNELLRISQNLDGRPVLFLTQEAGVRIVSESRKKLEGHYLFNLPQQSVVEELTTKSGFQLSAAKYDAPIPKTKILRNKDDLIGIEDFAFPVVFKPNAHSPQYSKRFRKAYRLNSFAEVEELYEKVYPTEPSIVVQEWIDGQDSDIYFCLQYRQSEDRALMSFCGRKIQSHPPMTGGTASCTIAPEDMWPEITGLTDTYFSKAGVTGMCSMEFKRDRRSGKLFMIEPTIARSDYQEEIATWHGYNIPATAYQHLTNGPEVSPRPISQQQIWQDKQALRHYPDHSSNIEQSGASKRGALFSWRDPYPWVFTFKNQITRKIRSLTS